MDVTHALLYAEMSMEETVRRKNMQNVKKEDAKTKYMSSYVEGRQQKFCCQTVVLKATWVLTLEIAKRKNDYSFHAVPDKFIAKTTPKEKSLQSYWRKQLL